MSIRISRSLLQARGICFPSSLNHRVDDIWFEFIICEHVQIKWPISGCGKKLRIVPIFWSHSSIFRTLGLPNGLLLPNINTPKYIKVLTCSQIWKFRDYQNVNPRTSHSDSLTQPESTIHWWMDYSRSIELGSSWLDKITLEEGILFSPPTRCWL